ncbi:MarR family winged helix-turn-helix transcriptional regulator [Pedobacter sp. CFBP9032]|uniref:MarR family winged helix-turn-helix transcriptional regulator n=1 Tax=Pedobacter sp. CFBP9032 TaxID=3096539 RepID=UPI002A69BF5F|nr:MarR family transcriptional regulator [Pedobacter sp. CFBP9032]MDY0904725.1 MarR family transcriptional regulator [Pedobacter sp. CFBP9032]
MLYNLINELLGLVQHYETSAKNPADDLAAFYKWLDKAPAAKSPIAEPDWNGKENGRSADSVINTSLVHLYRYAKMQAKMAIAGTTFSTSDEFIYLISLANSGSMSKTALIKQNVHEKAAGTLIINRLIKKGFVEQQSIDSDKRSRIIVITEQGKAELNASFDRIRTASANVTEPLSEAEKMTLISLLLKLEDFHWAKSEGKF